MSTLTQRSLPALALALAAFVAYPAAAQQSGAAVITQYFGAAEAQDLCGGAKLSEAQISRVSQLAQESGGATVLTGDMVALIQQGRDSTRVRRFGLNGCNDPIVQERLNFFRTNIQPKL